MTPATRVSASAASRAAARSPTANAISTSGSSNRRLRDVLIHLVHGPADRRPGDLRSVLRQPQQGEAGLRPASPLTCLAVGRLSLREVAAQPMELGLLVERFAHRGFRRRPREPLLRPSRLVDGLGPRAVESLQLGPVHEAPAAERNEIGLRVAPRRERLRPLLGTTQVEDLLEGIDRGAVHDPDDDRRDLAGRDRQHRLIEQRDAARHLRHVDERLSTAHPGQRREIGVAEALGDRGRAVEGVECGNRVSCVELTQALRHEEDSRPRRSRPRFPPRAGRLARASRRRRPCPRD